MLLYKDIISGDEMITDAFDLKEVDDLVFEVDCKMITIREGADVDIGANASAEEAAEELEDGMISVNNVVYSMRLVETQFDKKSYMTYIKGYMKKVKAYLEEKSPERAEVFEKGVGAVVKRIVGNFKDYEFFVGESMDPDGGVALLNYREDGMTPYLTFFKDGLKIEKL
jgi:hypothetical protein